MERDEIVAFHSVDPRVCPSKRDACASRYAFTLRPSPSDLEQATGIGVQQFLGVLRAERQRLQPFGAGQIFGEWVIDREQDAIDTHLHHVTTDLDPAASMRAR